jgi:hypothetical protein
MHVVIATIIVLLAIFLLAIVIIITLTMCYRDPIEYDGCVQLCYEKSYVQPKIQAKFIAAVDDETHFISAASNPSIFLADPLLNVIDCQTEKITPLVGSDYRVPESIEAVFTTIDARMFTFRDVKYLLYFAGDHQRVMKVDMIQEESYVTSGLAGARLSYENMDKIEKNWTPYVFKNNLYFITRLVPMKIVHCTNLSLGTCVLVHDDDPYFEWDPSAAFIRGGSPLISVDPTTFIGMCHTAGSKHDNWQRLPNYRVLLFIFDAASSVITCISKPLDVMGALHRRFPSISKTQFSRVHFGTAIYKQDNGDMLLGIDCFDAIPILFRWSADGVREFLYRSRSNEAVQHSENSVKLLITQRRYGGLSLVGSFFSYLHIKRLLLKSQKSTHDHRENISSAGTPAAHLGSKKVLENSFANSGESIIATISNEHIVE